MLNRCRMIRTRTLSLVRATLEALERVGSQRLVAGEHPLQIPVAFLRATPNEDRDFLRPKIRHAVQFLRWLTRLIPSIVFL